MPVIAHKHQSQTASTCSQQIYHRSQASMKPHDEVDTGQAHESVPEPAKPMRVGQNFGETINQKDVEIRSLNKFVAEVSWELKAKTCEVQFLKGWGQKVAQLQEQKKMLRQQNESLGRKCLLYMQVNERQFKEMGDLQEEKRWCERRICEVEDELRVERSTKEIKLAEKRLEVWEQKQRNGKLEKQVILLKSIIKELEDEDESTSDNEVENSSGGESDGGNQQEFSYGSYRDEKSTQRITASHMKEVPQQQLYEATTFGEQIVFM